MRTGSGQFDDLRAAFAARPWDVIVAESTSLGAALVAESTGTPWATVALTPLTLPSIALPPPGLTLRPAAVARAAHATACCTGSPGS